MNFDDFFYISELGFLIESPVIATRAMGSKSKYIDPSTGKSWRKIQKIQQLKAIKEEHLEDSLYVHFTDGVNVELNPGGLHGHGRRTSKEPKLGVNPKAKSGGTPIGIYAYPIDYVIKKDAKVPYGENRNFLLVFKIKRKNILYANKNNKEITDLDEIIKLLQIEESETVKDIIAKQTKYFEKSIEKINLSTKKELKNEIPAVIVNFIFKTLESWAKDTPPLKIKKLSNFYKSPELYFGTEDDDDKKSYIEYFLLKMYRIFDNEGQLKNIKININLEELTFEIVDENGVVRDKNGQLIKDISILEKFEHIEKEYGATRRLLKILSLQIIKNSSPEKDLIFKKFEEKIIKISDKISSFLKAAEKQKEKKISDFNFPFKEEFIKIANEYDLDLLANLENLLKNWSSSEIGASRSTNASNFVYKFTGILSKEIANIKDRQYYVVWTELLKRLGFKGVVDDEGSSTIHASEPIQSVFFDTKQLELVGVVKNTRESVSAGSGSVWKNSDSPFLRWQKGILNSIKSFYWSNSLNVFEFVQNGSRSNHAHGLILMFNRISKITMYLQSYLRFSDQIEKEQPRSITELKSLLRSMLLKGNEPGSFSWFLDNYEKAVGPIKEQELLKYANILREIMEKISQFIISTDSSASGTLSEPLKTELPNPSQLRGIILKLNNFTVADETPF